MQARAHRERSVDGDKVLSLLGELLGQARPRDFAVRLWDGATWEAEPGRPRRFTLVLRHPGALRAMFWQPTELRLSEAYVYDDFEIEGDIEGVFPLAEHLLNRPASLAERLRRAQQFRRLPSNGHRQASRPASRMAGARHSRERDRAAIAYHYDVSNDFYRLWLDERMVYTCAYFTAPDDDLDMAQERKLDYVCRKLRLRPGERLLDLGCGWGGLVLHAVRHYGVTARGVTLSRAQAELAQERIARAGLADRCRVEARDYREVDEPGGYDKVASVGMFEHVGEALLPECFQRIRRQLRPGGAFLYHAIASQIDPPVRSGPSFIERYVFPDSELVPISTTLRAAETSGFEVRDVESLREHYILTLQHWVRRLEAHHEEARRITDEVTYRVWRLYMGASAHGFRTGRHNLYQALLVKPDRGDSRLPLTRADWYV